jgi:enoyl-CoA hydratase
VGQAPMGTAGAAGLVVVDDLGGGVRALVLNRPERRNALNDELIEALVAAVGEAVGDAGVRVVVLRGAGPSFSSGGDLSGAGSAPASAADDSAALWERRYSRFLALWDAPKPIVAQVHGHCLGTALALCSCVDLVVVSTDAVIGWPLPLGGGLIGPSWAFHVGARKAKELSFQPSSTITGAEAAELGWANDAVPAGELAARVEGLAARIARTPSGVLRVKKAAINAVSERMGFREALRAASTFNALAHSDPEVEEVRALVRELGAKEAAARLRR